MCITAQLSLAGFVHRMGQQRLTLAMLLEFSSSTWSCDDEAVCTYPMPRSARTRCVIPSVNTNATIVP